MERGLPARRGLELSVKGEQVSAGDMKGRAVPGLGSCRSKAGRYEVWGSSGRGCVVHLGKERNKGRNRVGYGHPCRTEWPV